MRKVGTYLVIFGLGSIILSFMNMNFRLLMWIDSWGETTGWMIRGAFIVLGIILFVMGKPASQEEEAEAEETAE